MSHAYHSEGVGLSEILLGPTERIDHLYQTEPILLSL